MSRDEPTIHPGFEDQEDPVVESLEIGLGRRGKQLDRWVTFRDLKDQGAFQVDNSGVITGVGPGFGGSGEQFAPDGGGDLDFGEDDLSVPPAPTNVRARGLSLDAIGVTWDPSPVANHAYAEVFASQQQFWTPIRERFNAERPIGNGNSSPNFMGRASGTLFLHRGLTSTVPTLNLAADVTGFSNAPSGTFVIMDPGFDPSKFFIAGEKAFLTAPGGWEGNGVEGTVIGFDGNSVQMSFDFDPDPNSFGDAPANAQLVRVPDPDDLEAALNPTPIYYWVRFVSTAGIVGPVQDEEGAEGRVMIDPEAVLNVLTGRIRKSNLANDIIAPINFISGPIGQFDSIRDFVETLDGEAVTSFSRTLWEEYLGEVTPDGATAGAALREVRGELDIATPFIEDLNTLQLGSEDFEGFPDLMSTIVQRALVKLDDGAAIAHISDNLQVEVGDEIVVFNEIGQRIKATEDSLDSSITLKVQANTGGVLTAAGFGIGLQSDQDNPGQLTSTFAVAADQFAIMSAANGGRIINDIKQNGPKEYRLSLDTGSSAFSVQDGLTTGARIAIALPFNAPSNIRNIFQGKTFVVEKRQNVIIASEIRLDIRKPADPDTGVIPNLTPISTTNTFGEGYAAFPEQSIPFVVNTTVDPPVVGIRGRLIVDGMISADEAEINDLLRANRIWAENITAFGLVNTHSLIGEAIATPRFGGWAMRMAMPDASKPKVLEFSRWAQPDGDPGFTDPRPRDDLAPIQELIFPQLTDVRKIDTAFWLDSEKGSAYIRGNLTVGGNARIWTGQSAGVGDWFTQMDQEFPIMILPQSMTGAAGIPAIEGADVVYNAAARQAVKANALFWASRDGTIGFNTQNGAIFAGDTPLEPPSGLGDIEVKARLDGGAPTGRGRVHTIVTVDVAANTTTEDRFSDNTYSIFIVDRQKAESGGYDDSAQTIRPSARIGDSGFQGPITNPAFVNRHFLIIRATSGTSGDPGLDALNAWKSRHSEIIELSMGSDNGPGHKTFQGVGSNLPASNNYRILVVMTERFQRGGAPIFGSNGKKIVPQDATLFTQQVSNTQ